MEAARAGIEEGAQRRGRRGRNGVGVGGATASDGAAEAGLRRWTDRQGFAGESRRSEEAEARMRRRRGRGVI